MKKVNLRKGRRLTIIEEALRRLVDDESAGFITREEAAELLNLLNAEEPAAYYGVTIKEYRKSDDLREAWALHETYDITD